MYFLSSFNPKEFRLFLCAAVMYCAIVAGLHWDVLRHLSSHVLAGSQVGGLFIWEFWWFKISLAHSSALNPFYSRLLFYPVGTPILIQSPLLLGLALVLQRVMDVYSAYNLLLLAAYWGAGISMMWLAYYVSRDGVGSFWRVLFSCSATIV